MTGPVSRCQGCDSPDLESILWLGYHPSVNDLRPIGEPARPYPMHPLELLRCGKCTLVQLGFVAPVEEVFPRSYPYRSSTTKALRDNFADLAARVKARIELNPSDLVVDIGGNDGNLLDYFAGHFRANVTPEDMGKLGAERGIPHIQEYWGKEAVARVIAEYGKARVVTATNVFAHTNDPHGFVDSVLDILTDDGLFVLENHSLSSVVYGLQWDAVYAEHQRVYSPFSLRAMLAPHGLRCRFMHGIATHGGSFRSYWSRSGPEATMVFTDEPQSLATFAKRVAESKADLWSLLSSNYGAKIAGIGAPSRASTLINYVGIDHNVCPWICETPGSQKIGKYMPGTRIEVVDEERLYREPTDLAILFAHHLSDELVPKIRAKGYRGKFIKPLPVPEVIG